MERIRSGWQQVRESLFFIPALVVAGLALVAWAAIRIDRTGDLIDSPGLVTVTVTGGRVIATTVAGATITVAAIVFSITALSSQITSTQYSPRAVAGFFEDRFQQLVIGLVVGTFVFSLLVLGWLGGVVDGEAPLGSLSVTLSLGLGIASVVGIIAYLDHSLRRMRIGAVVRRIAETTRDAVRRQHPPHRPQKMTEEISQPQGESFSVRASATGWVRSIDGEALARVLPAGAVADVQVRVGEAVSGGDLLARVWAADESHHRRVERAVRSVIHVGRERSIGRDPLYGIRQLVDIGLRALSPGINDPTTASDSLQHLKLPIREILLRDPPVRVHTGGEGQKVYLSEMPSRSQIVHGAFREIRLAARSQPEVLRTLIEILADLVAELDDADLAGRSAPLIEEAVETAEAARRAGFPDADLARVLEPAKRIDGGMSPPG